MTAWMSKSLVALALALAACTPAQEARVVAPPPSGAARATGPLRATALRAHNTRRARHCAPPLAWSDELARVAARWARELARRGCPLEHSDTRYGENLAAGSQGGFTPDDYVEMWYREVDDYRFKRGRFAMSTGHFTQLAWRSTRRVGCALTPCRNGLELFVCNYDPPGNVEGEFTANVLPASCK